MDIELSEERQILLATTRRFLDDENPMSMIRPRSGQGAAFQTDYWRRAANLGWTSTLIPDLGNSADSEAIRDLAVIVEEAGRSLQPGPLIPCNVVAEALVREGSSEQRSSFLGGLADGSLTASWAFAESRDGWERSDIAMSETLEGDEVMLNGVKSSVEAADTADVLLVTTRSPEGLRQYFVPRDAPGIEVRVLPTLDLSRNYADVSFRDVRVPRSARLGDGNSSDSQVRHQQLLTLTLQCAEMAGMLEKVFSWTLEFMQDRYAFGRPIASYQSLKHRVADHKVWIEAALGLSTGLTEAYAADDPDAMELACVAKSHIGDQSVSIISDCAQIFGGISMTWEHDLHLYLRRATVNRSLYGSPPQLRERLCELVGV